MRASRASLHSTVSSLSSGATSNVNAGMERSVTGKAFATGMTPIPEEKSFFESIHRASAGYNARRFKSAGSLGGDPLVGAEATSAASSAGSETSQRVKSVQREVAAAVPVTAYRGSLTQLEVAGLLPNRLYQFRLRHVGSRSNSLFSQPLLLLTRPLAPSAAIVLDVTPTGVRTKWYPPEFGAVKFLVELKQLGGGGGEGEEEASPWIAAYYGQENCWTSTILNPGTRYLLRVVAINAQEMRSEPSGVISFRTPGRDQLLDSFKDALKAKNAMETFNIECTNDICVGDVILLTERLFLRLSDSALVSIKAAEVPLLFPRPPPLLLLR